MFFATAAHPQVRRQAYANAGQSLERFMGEALRTSRNETATFTQDENSFSLSFDVPGIAKDQIAIAIEGAPRAEAPTIATAKLAAADGTNAAASILTSKDRPARSASA